MGDTPDLLYLPIPKPPQILAYFHANSYFCTINLDSITGLTFFLDPGGHLCAMHGHTKEKPYAEPPVACLSGQDRMRLTWIYVPISEGDQVTALAERSPPSAKPSAYIVCINTWSSVHSGLANLNKRCKQILLAIFP